MATLKEATQRFTPKQMARIEPLPFPGVQSPAHYAAPVKSGPVADQISPVLKCPLPLVDAQPDALRQYIRGGGLPQNRVLMPNS